MDNIVKLQVIAEKFALLRYFSVSVPKGNAREGNIHKGNVCDGNTRCVQANALFLLCSVKLLFCPDVCFFKRGKFADVQALCLLNERIKKERS